MVSQPRFVSNVVGAAAVLGLMVLMSGTRAHAQSMAITNFTTSGNPGGYYDVTDTANLSVSFYNIPAQGACGYSLVANTYYYSGPYASGTLLQSVKTYVHSYSQGLPPGNSTLTQTVNVNTPDLLRASEPAGTGSIHDYYPLCAGGGCNGWNASSIAGGPWSPYMFVVHG
jgi:hypothetical protein